MRFVFLYQRFFIFRVSVSYNVGRHTKHFAFIFVATSNTTERSSLVTSIVSFSRLSFKTMTKWSDNRCLFPRFIARPFALSLSLSVARSVFCYLLSPWFFFFSARCRFFVLLQTESKMLYKTAISYCSRMWIVFVIFLPFLYVSLHLGIELLFKMFESQKQNHNLDLLVVIFHYIYYDLSMKRHTLSLFWERARKNSNVKIMITTPDTYLSWFFYFKNFTHNMQTNRDKINK